MTRTRQRRTRTMVVVFFAVMCMLVLEPAALTAASQTSMLNGRLATVEPAIRRVTVVPFGRSERVEVFLADNGQVAHDGGQLTLADLVIEVGRRVIVFYRLDGDRRVAERVIVEPD